MSGIVFIFLPPKMSVEGETGRNVQSDAGSAIIILMASGFYQHSSFY